MQDTLLAAQVRALLDAVAASGKPPPAEVLILEAGPAEGEDLRFTETAHSLVDYEPRFERLLEQQLPWLNMVFCGAYKSRYSVVLIEHQGRNPYWQMERDRTFVNMGGVNGPWDSNIINGALLKSGY